MRAFMNWIKAAANHAQDWWNSVTNRPDNSPSDNQGAISKQSDNQDTNVQQNTNGSQASNSKSTSNNQSKSNNQNRWTEFWTNFWNAMDHLADNIVRAAMIGIILFVVATTFCPELPQKFPAIYGWYTGCAQLVEFFAKVMFKGLYSVFTGHWSEFVPEFWTSLNNMLQQFTNWIAEMHL